MSEHNRKGWTWTPPEGKTIVAHIVQKSNKLQQEGAVVYTINRQTLDDWLKGKRGKSAASPIPYLDALERLPNGVLLPKAALLDIPFWYDARKRGEPDTPALRAANRARWQKRVRAYTKNHKHAARAAANISDAPTPT